jgi:hypothetical protein
LETGMFSHNLSVYLVVLSLGNYLAVDN